MKKLIPYIVLLAAMALAWQAIQLRLDLFGYTQDDISKSLANSLLWMALPAIIAAVSLSMLLKRFTTLPRLAFFLLLLLGAILLTQVPNGRLTGAVILYLTIKKQTLFLSKPVTEETS